MDVDRLPLNNGSPTGASTNDRSLHFYDWHCSIVCHALKGICLDAKNYSILSFTQPGRIFCDYVQHRLNVGRRAGNDAQDFTCRRLLLQRLLEFVEKPHILNGDHGLVCEGLKQLDLRRGEGTRLDVACSKSSNDFSPLKKGSHQVGTPAVSGGTQQGEVILRADVGNVERAMLAHPAVPWVIDADCDTGQRYGTKMSALEPKRCPHGVAEPHRRS